MMTISIFQRTNELATSACQTPVYLSGDHLHHLFPPDPAEDANRLLTLGLIGHQPLRRTTEEKLSYFCRLNGITYRAYHNSKHYVIFKNVA